MEIHLEDASGIRATLKNASANINRAIVPRLQAIGLRLQNHMMRQELSGQSLNVRTGTGRRSIFSRVESNPGAQEFSVVVGADLTIAPYMRAQDQGATIRPVNGRYLTVPLPQFRTGKGVAKGTARQVISNPEAFGFTGTFMAKKVIFGRLAGGRIVPLFALVEQVVIRPVGFIRKTMDANTEWIVAQFDEAISPEHL